MLVWLKLPTMASCWERYCIFLFCLILSTHAFAQIQTTEHGIDNSLDGGFWIQAIDFDLDGDVDIVAASLREGLKWYQNDGLGTFERNQIASFPGAWSIHANDFDNDGDLDVVAVSTDLNETAWFERRRDGSFAKHIIDPSSIDPHSVYSADLDGDGDFDILVAAWGNDQVILYENRGLKNFHKRILDEGFSSAHSVYAADLDNDGDLEPIAGGGGKTMYWRNDGDLKFKKKQVGSFGAFSVFAADIDGDGNLDILRNQRNNGDIDWFRNTSAGFIENTLTSDVGEVWSIFSGDLDLDGDQDVVTAGFERNNVSAWINNGGAFTEARLATDLIRPRAVTVADFDGDGDPDVAAVTRTDRVVWYEILGSPPTATLSIIQPNGGESIEGGSNYSIAWDFTRTLASVDISFSTDGGSAWNPIVTNTPNTGSYAWQVPQIQSSQVMLSISASDNQTIADTSDAFFSITNAGLTVTAPNGGESWLANTNQTITWTANGSITQVKLEFSSNSGNAWETVVANTSNNGSFAWLVPDVATGDALIRVSDAADGVPSDVSDATFTITQPHLSLTSPNGGEDWFGGSLQTIRWNSEGGIASVRLEYSSDNGINWHTITDQAPNSGTYTWSVPNLQSPSVRVRISDASDGNPFDTSDAPFTITLSSVTITAPNGGENWPGGSTQNITWSATGQIAALGIEYSLNAGTSWQTVAASTPNTGSHAWSVPNVQTSTAMIRLVDPAHGTQFDASDNSFSIAPTALVLTAPNGGETWPGGSQQTINWQTTGAIDSVRLEYSINGIDWHFVGLSNPNANSYLWTVPDINSSAVIIRVSDAGDGVPSDQTDNPFTIRGTSLTLTAPNGGERWASGSTQAISWLATGSVQSITLQYSINNGEGWNLIVAQAPNTGRYNWTVPTEESGGALVRISDASDGSPSDQSDAVFSIIKATGTLALTSPNGGEFWSGETKKRILWSATGNIPRVKLEFSVDNGTTWLTIASDLANTGSYDWTVPDIQSTQALVRVSDAATGLPSDMSNKVFTIISSSLRLIAPNGGESWMESTMEQIRWASTGVISHVKLEYSLNNGLNWHLLADRILNTGTFEWRVPNTPSESVILRISDSADANPQDMSDTPFRIQSNVTDVRIVQGAEIPERFDLLQNYPNPFNPITTIRFAVPHREQVSLAVYNFLGQPVVTLLAEEIAAGEYSLEWDASQFPSGTYFYRMQAGEFVRTMKLTLLK